MATLPHYCGDDCPYCERCIDQVQYELETYCDDDYPDYFDGS